MPIPYSKRLLFLFAFCLSTGIFGQKSLSFFQKADSLHLKRRNAVVLSEIAVGSGALIALNSLWYTDHPRSSFHFTNDNKQWKQMDKAGHIMTSYAMGKIGMDLLAWSGVRKKDQHLYGATLGFAFLSAVEVLDGFSKEWGASMGDVLANGLGTGILIGQDLLWNEQRIQLKYSFSQSPYAKERPGTLGSNLMEQSIKDYNGQTYWLSANLWSFAKHSSIPKWFNIAVGYGAEGMLFGEQQANQPNVMQPYRQFYLSLDLDLTKINTNSRFLNTLFSALNFIKIPAPTLEITSHGKVRFHTLFF